MNTGSFIGLLKNAILPVAALSTYPWAMIARMTRSSVPEVFLLLISITTIALDVALDKSIYTKYVTGQNLANRLKGPRRTHLLVTPTYKKRPRRGWLPLPKTLFLIKFR